MKDLDSFTVERLEEFIRQPLENGLTRSEQMELARIALAAKRAEPVYQYHTGIINEEGDIDWYWVDCDKGFYSQYDNQHRRIVYTTSQLNSPEIPEGWKLVPIEPTQNMVYAHISGMQLAGFSRAYRDMLAAAPEPQNQQQNIPENIPQGWIKCSDQMPEDDTLCLGVDECGVIWTMHFDDGEFRADTGDVDDLEISHWMPLPAAPEKPL